MSQDPDYCVYIVTNHTQTVLYIGVTSDLEGRLWEHAHGQSGGKFTRQYHVNTLLYYEQFGDVNLALAREKQLKGWTRAKKEWLIRTKNPTYADLGPTLYPQAPCRGPEGPSTALVPRSAQDDRVFSSDRVAQRTDTHPASRIRLRLPHPSGPPASLCATRIRLRLPPPVTHNAHERP